MLFYVYNISLILKVKIYLLEYCNCNFTYSLSLALNVDKWVRFYPISWYLFILFFSQVICSNIINVPNVVQSANVILLNNVFQCFVPVEIQRNIWQWLKNIITPGTVIITIPSIEETLNNLQVYFHKYCFLDVKVWIYNI